MNNKGTIVEIGERSSGLIKRTGQKELLFFHADALVGVGFTELKKGDKVVFSIVQSKKGPYAANVRRA